MYNYEKIKKRIKLLTFVFSIILYILLIYSANQNNMYEKINVNWFDYVFNIPFIEITRLLNKVIDFRIAYFIVFLFFGIFLTIAEKNMFIYFKKIIIAYFVMIKAYKSNYKSEEEKIDAMFKPLEDANFSFLKIIFFIFKTFFSLIFSENVINQFNVSSFNVLWFELNGKENIPILFLLYLLLSFGVAIITFIIKIIKFRKTNNKEEKEMAIYNLLISFSLSTLLIYSVFNSAIFGLFICTMYISNHLIKFYKNKKSLIN